MAWTIEYADTAKGQLRKLDKQTARRIVDFMDAQAPEFELARELISARMRAGLTQGEVAARMGTTQSVVARIESGRGTPSMRTVHNVLPVRWERVPWCVWSLWWLQVDVV